jgi:Domain of unknown function (DUF4268)
VLAQTETIRRVLLVAQDGTPIDDAPPDASKEEASADPDKAWFIGFWTEYMRRLRTNLDDLLQPLPSTPGKGTNIYLPLPPGRSQCWISVCLSRSRYFSAVYIAMSSAYEHASATMDALTQEKEVLQAEIGAQLHWGASWSPYYIGVSTDYTSLDDPVERERVFNFLVTMTNIFVNTFRPRMEKLAAE